MKTAKNLRKAGLTLVETMIVVAIIGLLAAIAIPSFNHARASSQANSPINFPGDLTPYIKLNANSSIPGCPAGGVYSIAGVSALPACSLGKTVTPAHVLP
jgi:prepilin-type N-terminal cleavage/methylation domain-containing protein